MQVLFLCEHQEGRPSRNNIEYLTTDRTSMDKELQEAMLKRIRMKRAQKRKGSFMSSKERNSWERKVYEDVFLNP